MFTLYVNGFSHKLQSPILPPYRSKYVISLLGIIILRKYCTISNEVSSWRDSLKFKTLAKIYYGAFKVLNLNKGVDL